MDKRGKTEKLFESLREVLSTYRHQFSVKEAIAVLQRLENELTEVALQMMDAGKAIDDFTIDSHGVVQEDKN